VLDRPVEVIGPIELHLFVASSARDTDFTGKLVDVYPDSRAMILTEGAPRALDRRRTGAGDHEPIAPEDMAMRGMAASLGIVKGRPFQPDAHMTGILNAAAGIAFKMAAVESYASSYPDVRIYPDRRWEQVFLGGSPVFRQSSYLDFDALMNFFHKAYSTSDSMVLAMPGRGSQYLVVMRDADGDFLDPAKSYRLHMPANVPVKDYWSVVLYDTDTRALLDNGQPFPSIASNSNLTPNPDGSADVYFGPTAPATAGANWIRTVPGRGYFAAIRLYSPTQTYFDKVWKPGDIEKLK
jgi:hypothetical protein